MIKATLLSFAVALSACATAATTVGFPAADADDNDALSPAEFNEFFDDTDAFEKFDDDDDGFLNRTEYNEAVDSPYEADSYFTPLDANQDAKLDRSEFIGGWFGMFDGDKNGALSKGEFENAIESLEVEL